MTDLLYHIISQADWATAKTAGSYEPPSLRTEGFIHLSKQSQVLGAASRYYAGRDDLLLLVIDPKRLEKAPIWENTLGGTELFPHLYDRLNLAAVVRVERLEREENGAFLFPK